MRRACESPVETFMTNSMKLEPIQTVENHTILQAAERFANLSENENENKNKVCAL